MGRPKSNNVQINISIPMEWKKELENIACRLNFFRHCPILITDMSTTIRRIIVLCICQKFNLF